MYIGNKGFTLVELAIVLVIVGLLVGGVIKGQELIKEAKIRSAVARIGDFNSGLNTFRAKYKAIPGDIKSADAFGINRPKGASATSSNHITSDTGTTNDDGNGDGILQAVNTGTITYDAYAGEYANFWVHLSSLATIYILLLQKFPRAYSQYSHKSNSKLRSFW